MLTAALLMPTASRSFSVPATLGPLKAVYRDRPFVWRDLFLLFVPGTLAVLLPLLYGFMRRLYAQANYGPVAAQTWSYPWYLLAAGGALPLLLALCRVRRAHRKVSLYKNGLLIEWTGGRRYVFLWGDLHALACSTVENRFLGLLLTTRYNLTLFPLHGKPLRISDRIRGLPELTARIKAKLYPRWLPGLRAALQRGETLSFGVVSIHQRGICLRGREIPWEQQASIGVVRGNLVVESSLMRRIKIPVHHIPNIELLIQLLQEGVRS